MKEYIHNVLTSLSQSRTGTYTWPKYIWINLSLQVGTEVVHGRKNEGCIRIRIQPLDGVVARFMQAIGATRTLRTRHKRAQDRFTIKGGEGARAHDAADIALRLVRDVEPARLARPVRDGRQGDAVEAFDP